MTVIVDGTNGLTFPDSSTKISNAVTQATVYTSGSGTYTTPTKANPYLINQAEFIAYRSTVRGYAVNPVVDPIFPTIPTEQWSS